MTDVWPLDFRKAPPVKTKTTTTVYREQIIDEIYAERDRQDLKFGWIGSPGSILPGYDEYAKSAVLGEEFGEVCRAVIEASFGNPSNLEDELIQVAAVAVAWLEARREKAAQA